MRIYSASLVMTALLINTPAVWAQMALPPPAAPVPPSKAIQHDVPAAAGGSNVGIGVGKAVSNSTFKGGAQHPVGKLLAPVTPPLPNQ